MKTLVAAATLLGALGLAIPARPANAQISISVTLGSFYDELSPYGQWVDCRYGECWAPRGVSEDWQPYSNGQWIYTRYGWTWVSDDPWGASPYHYGTWDFVSQWGWVWVPGTVWAPAWVTWSYSDRYVGWAPMPPTASFGRSGYSGRAVVVSQERYVFVQTNQFVGTNVRSVREAPRRNSEMLHEARAVTSFGVSGGIVTNVAIPLATVQQASRYRIETREIGVARTTPRSFASTGGSRNAPVTIVAPEKEVRAARAAHQQSASPDRTQQQRDAGRQQEQAKQQEARQQQDSREQQQQQAKQQEGKQRQQDARNQQQQDARNQQQQQAKQQEARQQQDARNQQQQQARQQEAKQQQQDSRNQQQQAKQQEAKQQEAKQQEAKQQQDSRNQQQQQAKQQEARQQQQDSRNQQQQPKAQPQQQEQPRQGGQHEAKQQEGRQQPPGQQKQDGSEKGKDQEKNKKDPPGGDERPR